MMQAEAFYMLKTQLVTASYAKISLIASKTIFHANYLTSCCNQFPLLLLDTIHDAIHKFFNSTFTHANNITGCSLHYVPNANAYFLQRKPFAMPF